MPRFFPLSFSIGLFLFPSLSSCVDTALAESAEDGEKNIEIAGREAAFFIISFLLPLFPLFISIFFLSLSSPLSMASAMIPPPESGTNEERKRRVKHSRRDSAPLFSLLLFLDLKFFLSPPLS